MKTENILEVKNLKKYFSVQKTLHIEPKSVKAVDDVSFPVARGETFSLVGESGCGKSTTARCIMGLTHASEGSILFEGNELTMMKTGEQRKNACRMQMIFQDPYLSLNPRMPVGKIIEEPLEIHHVGKTKMERMEMAMDILEKVGIRPDQYYRYPHEFSGGQRQRIGIARALILKPEFIICDEPVSALDVSIQSQVLNLLEEMKQKLNMTYLFISHNMSVVRYISDRIGVMYLGHLVELADTDELFSNPLHPYTQALLSAVPEADPRVKKEQILLEGDIPSPLNPPSGCVFHNRCPCAKTYCGDAVPSFKEVEPGHYVSCFLSHEIEQDTGDTSL
jgi:oligopeptide transport system ATP-binding protein